ncbi:thiol reductase thioredoxin [Psychromonas marina]|uniref:Thiol reductase thioredoxin n=2 Tax=Psychromonas marina TaxID=88364 RepID=A0ABQ6DZ34_9GAMM|nr:thiol reductase thioredoxin [Psychromonas marina]
MRINDSLDCVRCKSDLLEEKPIDGTVVNLMGLTQSDKPILVKFWAHWCNACSHFEPVFEAVSAQQPDVCFVKVDIQAQLSLGVQYNIRTIPTVMLFKQGKVVDTLNDALPKAQFNQWLQNALLK